MRKGHIGRTNKWGRLGRAEDDPASRAAEDDRFAPIIPPRASPRQRAEVARRLRPATAPRLHARQPNPLAQVDPAPLTARRRQPRPWEPPAAPAKAALPEAAQRALIKACPPLVTWYDPDKVLSQVFRAWDTDGSGTLSKREIDVALGQLGVADSASIDALYRSVDKDNSGEIDYREFAAHIAQGMTNPEDIKGGGIVPELRRALDSVEAQGGVGAGDAQAAEPPLTQAEQAIHNRVQRAAAARLERNRVEAERGSWRDAKPAEAQAKPSPSPRPSARSARSGPGYRIEPVPVPPPATAASHPPPAAGVPRGRGHREGAREALYPAPGTPSHASEAERLQRVSASREHAPWQAADAARTRARREAKLATMRAAAEGVYQRNVVTRCALDDQRHEANIETKLQSYERYVKALAVENRRFLIF